MIRVVAQLTDKVFKILGFEEEAALPITMDIRDYGTFYKAVAKEHFVLYKRCL